MRWHIQSTLPDSPSSHQDIINLLLENRDLTNPQDIDKFLNPIHPDQIDFTHTTISPDSIKLTLSRLHTAIDKGEPIVIYGDYDADGICATAILWQTLHSLGAKVTPFIPHRERHGYGLSLTGLQEIISDQKPSLILTVDNGIVAHEAADFLADQGIDLIITDHHQQASTLPKALTVVHSDQVCGAGVSWLLSKAIHQEFGSTQSLADFHHHSLDLLCIGTIADLMSLTGINRSFVKFGLDTLTTTHRPGLVALKKQAEIEPDTVMTTFHVGYILGPRINAMGRLAHGLDALRLLCTTNQAKATQLAGLLDETNKSRQEVTIDSLSVADQLFLADPQNQDQHLIVVSHSEFHEGVIGLIAGKLVEKYSKPAIVISQNPEVSKASARSLAGINIIELIRAKAHLLVNAGGHPGAAGFSIQTQKIDEFTKQIQSYAIETISKELLEPALSLECQLSLTEANLELYDSLQQLAPFGPDNPQPLFAAPAKIRDFKLVGRDKTHLKLVLDDPQTGDYIHAIGFGLADHAQNLAQDKLVQVAFSLEKNEWNGRVSPQLFIKDIKV